MMGKNPVHHSQWLKVAHGFRPLARTEEQIEIGKLLAFVPKTDLFYCFVIHKYRGTGETDSKRCSVTFVILFAELSQLP